MKDGFGTLFSAIIMRTNFAFFTASAPRIFRFLEIGKIYNPDHYCLDVVGLDVFHGSCLTYFYRICN